ncbi:unnamed protein product [Arabidopsis thaliana]|uniref:Uncharacterized protein n=1 Tax=Arabidopsis thaliana TaxID=3702 RepID=A0A5S9XW06_ARATH|nr:unnamed protein product [Arabidopsis thaliana]
MAPHQTQEERYGHNLMRNHNKVETLVHMASQFMVFRAEESWEEKYVYYTVLEIFASFLDIVRLSVSRPVRAQA